MEWRFKVLLLGLFSIPISTNAVPYEWNLDLSDGDVSENEIPNEIVGTKHIYKHIQTGSAHVPYPGARVNVSPNQTAEYMARIHATVISPGEQNNRRFHAFRKPKTYFVTRSGIQRREKCLRCPPEKTVIAQKGVDGVLIELPEVMNCQNQPLANYELQTLFGNKYPFVLTQGSHTFIGRIVNLKTKQVEQTCALKYKVIVRQCPKYYARSKDLKLKCDSGNVWGSKCSFSCKENSGLINHQEPIFCNNDLEWIGEEPTCFQRMQNDYAPSNEPSSCELPLPPRNAKFSCETNQQIANNVLDRDFSTTPSGSICRVKCNIHFEILPYLERYSIFQCYNGHWNSSVIDFCSRIRKRHFIQ